MKKLFILMFGLSLALGTAVSFAQENPPKKEEGKKGKKKKGSKKKEEMPKKESR